MAFLHRTSDHHIQSVAAISFLLFFCCVSVSFCFGSQTEIEIGSITWPIKCSYLWDDRMCANGKRHRESEVRRINHSLASECSILSLLLLLPLTLAWRLRVAAQREHLATLKYVFASTNYFCRWHVKHFLPDCNWCVHTVCVRVLWPLPLPLRRHRPYTTRPWMQQRKRCYVVVTYIYIYISDDQWRACSWTFCILHSAFMTYQTSVERPRERDSICVKIKSEYSKLSTLILVKEFLN